MVCRVPEALTPPLQPVRRRPIHSAMNESSAQVVAECLRYEFCAAEPKWHAEWSDHVCFIAAFAPAGLTSELLAGDRRICMAGFQ